MEVEREEQKGGIEGEEKEKVELRIKRKHRGTVGQERVR